MNYMLAMGKVPTMTKYTVTLNFTFEPSYWDDDMYEVEKTTKKAKKRAFERTDKYFEEHDLTEHIKSNDAFGFVEYTISDGEVLSAHWDPTKFAIHMVVETDQTPEELKEDLEMNSLEDGEYEACGDTGWIVMTRGPNGEQFGHPWDLKNYWVYGLTDYRNNTIEVTKLEEDVQN